MEKEKKEKPFVTEKDVDYVNTILLAYVGYVAIL